MKFAQPEFLWLLAVIVTERKPATGIPGNRQPDVVRNS
jgi:hypothetical protein